MDAGSLHNVGVASEHRYRDLFENIPACIFVVNLTGEVATILDVNHRAEIFYGYNAGELIGSPATILVPEESRAAVRGIMRRVRRGETVTAEILNRRKDGSSFPVRIIAALDRIYPGQMIILVEDIYAQWQRRNDTEALEAERLRIAHEIHDGVAQNLAGLRFKSALWHHLFKSATPEMLAAWDELQVVLTDAIEDIRRVIFALRPLDMELEGFLPALTHWVAEFSDQNQLPVPLEISGMVDHVPTIYELPLLRMIQEGLNNIRQHASASTVLVQLAVEDGGDVTLTLQDNGRGFDPGLVRSVEKYRHYGLRQMRERIVELNGTLDIYSVSGEGTTLFIRLPRIQTIAAGASNG